MCHTYAKQQQHYYYYYYYYYYLFIYLFTLQVGSSPGGSGTTIKYTIRHKQLITHKHVQL
jgi:hypothetical protein